MHIGKTNNICIVRVNTSIVWYSILRVTIYYVHNFSLMSTFSLIVNAKEQKKGYIDYYGSSDIKNKFGNLWSSLLGPNYGDIALSWSISRNRLKKKKKIDTCLTLNALTIDMINNFLYNSIYYYRLGCLLRKM